jgi:hypothetical protein
MPKKRPEPFWREQTRCYYVQLGKKQHRLDPDETTAWRLYHELYAQDRSPGISSCGLAVSASSSDRHTMTSRNQIVGSIPW